LARKITWEECANVVTARLRENELLRLFRPRLNSVNTHPEAYGFIGLRAGDGALELWLTNDQRVGARIYGAFKPARRRAFGALLRLLWQVCQSATSAQVAGVSFPRVLLAAKPPARFEFKGSGSEEVAWGELGKRLHHYLSGESNDLVELIVDALAALPEM